MTSTTLAKSFKFAIRGIFRGISSERNLKIQAVIGLFVIIISLILRISKIYFIVILVVSFLVIILELFNKNFERLINLVSPEYNKEFGEIKDIMAGIVLSSSILAIIVGLLILYKPLINVLKIASKSFLFLGLVAVNIILIMIVIRIYKKKTISQSL